MTSPFDMTAIRYAIRYAIRFGKGYAIPFSRVSLLALSPKLPCLHTSLVSASLPSAHISENNCKLVRSTFGNQVLDAYLNGLPA